MTTRTMSFLILLCSACLGIQAQTSKDAIAELAQSISWYGQGCLAIPVGKILIYVDPFGIDAAHAKKADLILITHEHSDHYSKADIMPLLKASTQIRAPFIPTHKELSRAKLLASGTSMTYKGIKIEAVPAYNIVKVGNHPKSRSWVGFILSINGIRVYVAGDTERIPEMKAIKADIVFLPLGQTYTMGSVEEAAQAALDCGARIAIPCHYGMYEGKEEDAQAFAQALAGKVEVLIKERE